MGNIIVIKFLFGLSFIKDKIKDKLKSAKKKYADNKERKKQNYVKLITITCDSPEDGPIEYHAHTTEVPLLELPREAKHITGHKGYYCLVDMDPEYIPYREAEIEETEEGEEVINDYNVMTAIDYWSYSRDNRIDKGFQAVGNLAPSALGGLDAKKLIVIGFAAIVAIYFVTHMS